jgi:hypothetical protein
MEVLAGTGEGQWADLDAFLYGIAHWKRLGLFDKRLGEVVKQRFREASRVENSAVTVVSRWLLGGASASPASIGFGLALFPVPAHRTGLADFPHPALGKDSRFRPRKARGPVW